MSDSIEIVNSIPADQMQTSLRIFEHALDLQYNPEIEQCSINIHQVLSADDLWSLLNKLTADAEADGNRPILHIESHGSVEGLELANGDFVDWAQLQPYFYRLNRATRNQLFLVMATCWGFYGIKAMLGNIEEGASLRLLVGPRNETTSGAIETAMKRFYSTLLSQHGYIQATVNACEFEPTLCVYSAEEAFLSGWRVAIQNHPSTDETIAERARRVLAEAQSVGSSFSQDSQQRAETFLRNRNFDAPFQAYKRAFFMLEDFPEVSEQIAHVTLEAVSF